MASDREPVHALYKQLIALYPRAFREQLGESMQQTFRDLYHERQGQKGLFGFVLWTFIDTAIGIVQEYSLSMRERNPMQTMFANFKLPAIISFLIILPLMLLDFMFGIRSLDAFSFRNALDFVVLFGFLWLSLTAIIFILTPVARALRAENTGMAASAPVQGSASKSFLTNPAPTALLGALLALPFLTILTLLVLGIEPPLGPLQSLLDNPDPDQPDFGSLIILGAFLLLIAACIVVRAPIVRTLQAGGSLRAHPVHLLLAVILLLFITMPVAGVIIDQFPCWIGVPNCD